MLTIDAAVLLAASLEDEAASPEARDFLRAVGRSGEAIHEPALAIVELAAGVARRTGRRDLVAEGVRLLVAMPAITFHPLDVDAAILTAMCATDLGLRAGDAVYAAVAQETASTLVTYDMELLDRASAAFDVVTPAEWLARQSA